MTPVCPSCGSVAVLRRKRVAACMNPHCRDNGTIRRVEVFREAADQPPDPRKLAIGNGGSRLMPVWYE